MSVAVALNIALVAVSSTVWRPRDVARSPVLGTAADAVRMGAMMNLRNAIVVLAAVLCALVANRVHAQEKTTTVTLTIEGMT